MLIARRTEPVSTISVRPEILRPINHIQSFQGRDYSPPLTLQIDAYSHLQSATKVLHFCLKLFPQWRRFPAMKNHRLPRYHSLQRTWLARADLVDEARPVDGEFFRRYPTKPLTILRS